MVAAAVDAAVAGADYTNGFAPPGVAALAAFLGLVAVLGAAGWPREGLIPRWAVLTAGWCGCVLLVWSVGGIVFDGLRALAVLGVPGLPPVVDWAGFMTRAFALVADVLLAKTVLSYQRTSRAGCPRCGRIPAVAAPTGTWLGYAACLLALPYPLLKVYWSMGGTVAGSVVAATSVEGFPIGEIVIFSMVGLLALALVQRWGRVFPRWTLLGGGWTATGALVTMGALAGFGSLAQALGLVDGPAHLAGAGWVVSVVYGSWLLLGVALGGAVVSYQRRTRRRCGRCGG
ncbi:hypothetical protein [Dactylosporangium darangshiense]|uniref:Uncharacterized protein n=1 Tax=Dactylosporangium darangshiense TaxID=579108 RepID=A0ABP8DVM5_9ACTN